MASNGEIGYGLIGCGAFGVFCLRAYATMPQVRVVAVADQRADVARAVGQALGIPAYVHPADLLQRQDVQVVHVATPPANHRELALAAIKAGKHVLIEKPLAMDLAEADEILDAARSRAVIAPVNFVLRYNPVTDAVKAVIDSKVLGRVLAARLTNCATDNPIPAGHWFWDKSVSGGVFVEHGVHFFDLYSYWLGTAKVIGAVACLREGTGQEDRVQCTMLTDDGIIISHYHGFDQMQPMDRADHRLVCEMGDILVDGWIPLSMTVDAALDEAGVSAICAACPQGRIETIETYDDTTGRSVGRGVRRQVARRIRLRFMPQPDKLALYAENLRALLADQIAHIRDRSHVRRITEDNGRAALVPAETAARMVLQPAM